jgi:hypothetical protein
MVIPAGRLKLHCTAVGCAPPDEEMEIGTETMEPANPEPDPRPMETDWAIKSGEAKRARNDNART